MKNNIFGYLFFIFIVVIMGFAIYKVKTNSKEEENQTNTVSIVDTKQKGTKLTLGISEFDTINPIITKNKKVQDVTKLIYESLVNITADGKAEPCLAKEWETSDNITYIIKLRTGVKWTDGTLLSSNDVKFTIDRLLQDEEADGVVYAENVKNIKEVDIIDNTTLRIILYNPIPFYQYYLNFPILSSLYFQDTNFWDTEKNEKPITTGRFYIKETTGNTIVLEKNKNWWNIENENSVIDKITINIYSKLAELYKAFKLGSIDIIATENSNYQEYVGKIGYNTTEIEGRDFVFLALNTQSEILSDVNVRKAIRSAINKDEIVSNIYKGTYSKANFPLSSNSYLVDDENKNYFELSEFETLLSNADWKLRNKVWQKTENGKTKKLELNLVVGNSSKRQKTAEYIKEALASQGIAINIKAVSKDEFKNYLQNKQYDIILSEVTSSISPDLTTYFGDGNPANFNNEEVKDILKYLNNITNTEELKTKYTKLYEIYNEQVPYIGIGRSKIYVITNTYLNGEINSKWYNLFFNFNNWYTS